MKHTLSLLVGFAAALVLAGVGTAWARPDSHSVKVDLTSAVTLAGKTLSAGTYRLSWEGSGPEINVAVEHDGKILEHANAKLTDEGVHADQQSVTTRDTGNGAPVLEEVRMSGDRGALEFGSV